MRPHNLFQLLFSFFIVLMLILILNIIKDDIDRRTEVETNQTLLLEKIDSNLIEIKNNTGWGNKQTDSSLNVIKQFLNQDQ